MYKRQIFGNPGERADLADARIVLSGGLGMGSRENFRRLFVLAGMLGAAVGASRAAVAAGYAGYELQVGQTGSSVRPEIYAAFGISGAVQHLSGIAGAKRDVYKRQATISAIGGITIPEMRKKVTERASPPQCRRAQAVSAPSSRPALT